MLPLLRTNYWLKGHNFNKDGSGLLGDDTYQISRVLVLVVSCKKDLSCFPYISLLKTCDLGVGRILATGA